MKAAYWKLILQTLSLQGLHNIPHHVKYQITWNVWIHADIIAGGFLLDGIRCFLATHADESVTQPCGPSLGSLLSNKKEHIIKQAA